MQIKRKYSDTKYKAASHYRAIIRRCYSKEYYNYKNYGGRGIKVEEIWLGDDGLDNFCYWAYNIAGFEDKYSSIISINRVNNDKNYSPDNCYISYQTEQMNNKRDNIIINWYDQNFSLKELCRKFGIKYKLVKDRAYTHLPIHEALFSPPYKSSYHRKKIIDASSNGLVIVPRAFTFQPFQFVDHSTIDYRDPRREYPHPNHEQALNVIDYQNRETLKEQGTPVQPFRFTNSGSTDFLLYGRYQ